MFFRKIAPQIVAALVLGAMVWSAVSLAQFGNEPMSRLTHPVLPFASALNSVLPATSKSDFEASTHDTAPDSLAVTQPAVPSGKPEHTYQLVNMGHVLQLRLPDGEESLSIPARIDARIQGRRRPLQGAWRNVNANAFQASLISPVAQAEITVQLDPQTALIRVELDMVYRQNLRVDFERWRWRVHNVNAEVLDRGYRRVPLPAEGLFADHLTPHVGQWSKGSQPAFALLGDDTFEGVWYSPDEILFELDHLQNHPHTIVDDCYEAYDGERPWFDVSQSQRFLDERVSHRVTLVAGKAYPPLLGRWPDGFRAAMAFVDHADNGQIEQLRAIAYGSSERVKPSATPGAARGFLGHGIPITKTVFDTRQQLGNPHYRSLLEAFHQQGTEIAPHSITGGYDRPARIENALKTSFADFQPRTWVDHQPDTNCEAVNNWGGEPSSPDSMVEMLYGMGIRYFWEAPDPIGWKGLNLFRVDRPQDRGISFYPAMSLRTPDFIPWLFVSTWLFLPVDLIAERFQPEHLDAFETEAGLLIGHTYLSKIDADRKGERSVLRRDGDGNLYLHPKYDAMLAELSRRRNAGTLWLTTVSALGDWIARRSTYRVGAQSAESAMLITREGEPLATPASGVGLIPWPGSTLQWKKVRQGGGSRSELRVEPYLFDPQIRVVAADADARYADAAPSTTP